MSTHSDLFFAFDLKPERFGQIEEGLHYLMGTLDAIENPPLDSFFANDPEASFFVTEEWRGLLVVSNNLMSSFPGATQSALFSGFANNSPQYETLRHTLTFRDEILLDSLHLYYFFLDWIASYAETTGFIGYVHSQYNAYPSLLLFKDGRLELHNTNLPQNGDG